MSQSVRLNKVPTTDLDKGIMSVGDKFGSGASYQIRRSRQSGSGPLLDVKSKLNPTSTVTYHPPLNKKNREEAVPVSSTETKISTSVGSISSRSTANGKFLSVSGPDYLSEKRPKSKRVRRSHLLPKETTSINAETSGSSKTAPWKFSRSRINKSVSFQNEDDQQGNQSGLLSSKMPIRIQAAGEIQRGNLVSGRSARHHERVMKREAHWQNQDPPFFGMRYPSSSGGQHAEPLMAPHQHVDPQLPGYFGAGGYTQGPNNSTTTEPGGGAAHPYNVVGLLLAAASVIFIIIGIAFVLTRVRRRKPSPDEPDTDTNDLEMVETSKPDPYAQWLNMPEEEPPKPALKKQLKTVVRTVSRQISLTPKPLDEVFTPGVPEHLRYQLKQIYVY